MNIEPEPRIGDAERAASAAALGEHFAAGRLTREEYDERSTEVWSARTNADLRPMFLDLPPLCQQDPQHSAPQRPVSGYPQPQRKRWAGVRLLPIVLIVIGVTFLLPGGVVADHHRRVPHPQGVLARGQRSLTQVLTLHPRCF